MKAGVIISIIFGAILVFYLVGATFNDMSDNTQKLNTSIGIKNATGHYVANKTNAGAVMLKTLLPLLFAFGVVAGVYYYTKR